MEHRVRVVRDIGLGDNERAANTIKMRLCNK